MEPLRYKLATMAGVLLGYFIVSAVLAAGIVSGIAVAGLVF